MSYCDVYIYMQERASLVLSLKQFQMSLSLISSLHLIVSTVCVCLCVCVHLSVLAFLITQMFWVKSSFMFYSENEIDY